MRRIEVSRWISDTHWSCPHHVPSVLLPKAAPVCWMYHCASKRPDPICAVLTCDNVCSSKSKYCSRKCNNKNANLRYRARKKVTVQQAS